MAKTNPRIVPLILGFFSLILVWQVLAISIGTALLLPGPLVVLKQIFTLISSNEFWISLGGTGLRTLWAFFLSLLFALPMGILTGYQPWFEHFFSPFLAVFRSTPVISVIVLGLIWFSPEQAPIWVCLMMTFPMLTQAVHEGVLARNRELEEMARTFRLSRIQILGNIILPGLVPFLRTGGRASLGVAWKVVAAAEVLSMPKYGIGSIIQDGRTFLETDKVFGATIMMVLIAGVGDVVIERLLRLPHERKLPR